MQVLRQWITRNWVLKVFSLLLATMLWITVAGQTSSQIGMEVPLEYRNIPANLEITGDATTVVQVRLRGASSLIREISPRDVSTTVDLTGIKPGEKTIPLTPQNVQAPFGAEVLRVSPSSVRFNLERTVSKTVPVIPTISGRAAEGYEIGDVLLKPDSVRVEGPEGSIATLESVPTVPILIDKREASIRQNADLDISDPHLRLQRPAPVEVWIEIRSRDR